jgi:pimeloyl-ACP methyl ester carboxylesterase
MRLVLLLHGIVGFRLWMVPIARALRREGCSTLNPGYPSTRRSFDGHVAWLEDIVRAQIARPEVERIDFVGHSLGGLILRTLLARAAPPKAGRLVLVATPNRGSSKSERYRDTLYYRLVLGTRAGGELGTGPGEAAARAGVPKVPFGLVAGRGGGGLGMKALGPGEHDGVVFVRETELEGAADRIVVPYTHTRMLWRGETVRQVAAFLREGRFERGAAKRQPEDLPPRH